MQRFTGTDELNYDVEFLAGSSVTEPGITPATDVIYNYATWSQFSEEGGLSRVWAGVHFPDAVPAGQSLGREIGERAYQFCADHINDEGDAGKLRSKAQAPARR